MPPIAASNPGTSRRANGKKPDRLTKLAASAGITKKKKCQNQQRTEITSQSIFFSKKMNLLKSFSKINADLVKRATERQDKCNIFMDILKIAPVIDLAEDERSSTSSRITDTERNHHYHVPLKLSKGRSNPLITGQKNKTNIHQHNIVTDIEEDEISVVNTSITSMSDIDLREKPIDILEFRKKVMRKYQTKGRQLKSESRSDMDLRANVPQLPNQQHVLPSTSSIPSAAVSQVTRAEARLTSRIRFVNRSPEIDLNKQYQLLGLRYFQEIKGKSLGHNGYQSIPLNIVTFNVLCQRSREKVPHLYRHLHAPDQWIHGEWNSRYAKLINEFDRLKADVFCLQEVQDTHYEEFFQPFFHERGYQGFFTPRQGMDIPDGCAIFWRTSKLQLLTSKPVIYNLHVVGMDRDNVGQIAIFGLIGQQTAFCVTNTHIYYNMGRGEVKLAQITYLLASMRQTENQFKLDQSASNKSGGNAMQRTFTNFAGHILCGDFNMEPASTLHRFILDGKIDIRRTRYDMAYSPWSKERKQKQRENSMYHYLDQPSKPLPLPIKDMGISGNSTFVDKPTDLFDLKNGILTHEFKFASVYEYWNVIGEEEISTYHRDCSQPDFIFYSVSEQRDLILDKKLGIEENLLLNTEHRELAHENLIQLRRRLSVPTLVQLDRACGPLPNKQYGSDHLSMCAVFDIFCPLQKTN